MTKPEDQSLGDHIEAALGNNASHINVSQDASSVNVGDVEGGIHDSVIAGGDVHVYGDWVHGDMVAGDKVMGEQTTVTNISSDVVAVGHGAVVTNIKNFLFGEPEAVTHQRNRQHMLQLIESTWIEGVLKQSLHNAVLIDLSIRTYADAVEYPWEMIIRVPNHADRLFTQGTKILDVFDQMNQSLLILGQAGSGKTTMLLELGRSLIERAKRDPTLPIPIVFNLSSWTKKQQPLTEWLLDEFNTKYRIPKKVAEPWIEDEQVLLLLDGLDEVKAELRKTCVEAINTFLQKHLIPVVICSRATEYEALTQQLKLVGAVVLQPLTDQQISIYLDSVGDTLDAFRELLSRDAILKELAQSPLILNIMSLVYQIRPNENLHFVASVENRRKDLLNTYIDRMFTLHTRTHINTYGHRQTLQWLTWLAQNMQKRSQTIFLIEQLQTDWLKSGYMQWLHTFATISSVALLGGVTSGLSVGVISGLTKGLFVGLYEGFMGTIISGILIIAFFGLWGESIITPVEQFNWSLKSGLIFGLISGTAIGLSVGPYSGLYAGLISGIICGLIGGLLGGKTDIISFGDLKRVWKLRLTLSLFIITLISLVWGLFFNIMAGLPMSLLGSLGIILLGNSRTMEVHSKTIPNQGIYYSIRNGVTYGLLGMLLFSGIGAFIFSPIDTLGGGSFVGALGGTIFGLIAGGEAPIKHFILRFLLCRSGHMPWNYAYFLDYCVDRAFLRRVGGGYIFIHGLLLEHFANLADDDIEQIASAIKAPRVSK